MNTNGKRRWTPIQTQAIRFVFEQLARKPHSRAEVGELAFEYAKSLPPGHSRKCHNSRGEPKAMQDIRNIVSHATEPTNPIQLGFFDYDPVSHTLALTELGLRQWKIWLCR
jgi:hypothetical protein